MKKVMLLVLLICSLAFSYADLFAPATVRLLGTSNPLWDTIEITTSLENIGDTTAYSPIYPSSYIAVAVRIDSLRLLKYHSITYLMPNYFLSFKDTSLVLKGPFALTTQCDPLWKIETNGAAAGNNVLSWAINFHPTIYYDTVTIVQFDTINQNFIIHDTIKINDTLKIATHDTIWNHDTIKTSAKNLLAKTLVSKSMVYGEIYNIVGQCVWKGTSEQGIIPRIKLAQGTHLFIQGNTKKIFKVIYK